uniref:Uncharacterized protein n=1 Tax=Aegilops tauschii TaxID=37682 RepID=M8CGL3_AEGTA
MEMPTGSAQAGGRFPVPHKSLSLDIKGNKTDIVISKYEDNFLVIVTQIGCMGTILAAKKDESVFSDPTYNVSVLFGKRDEPLLLACARQLIEHISFCANFYAEVSTQSVQGTLKDVVSAIVDNPLW